MKNKNWLKESARDLIALGSIPFFILVLARVWILDNLPYFSQFAVAGILFLSLGFIFKSNLYSGLGLVILFFTANYYSDNLFTIIGSFLYVFLLVSLVYLKEEKIKILKGFLLGILSIGIGYWVVLRIFN